MSAEVPEWAWQDLYDAERQWHQLAARMYTADAKDRHSEAGQLLESARDQLLSLIGTADPCTGKHCAEHYIWHFVRFRGRMFNEAGGAWIDCACSWRSGPFSSFPSALDAFNRHLLEGSASTASD